MPHVVHFITSLEMGGAQAVLYDLISNLPQFSHSVIYIHGGAYEKQLKNRKIALYQIRGFISSYDPVLFFRLYRLFKKLNPDCIHTVLWAANWVGRIVAKMAGIPCVMACHNNRELNGWVRTILDRCAPSSITKVAVSDQVKKSFADPDMIVIPNGVDREYIGRQALACKKTRTDVGLLLNHIIIGSVGRLQPVKQYDLLIEVVGIVYQRHPQIRLILVGDGPEEQALRLLIASKRLQGIVQLVSGQRAYGYYPLFDCFVLSSAQEGISMALLEAMSCGLACITTSNEAPAHSVLTNGRDGLVCPIDKRALAEALERLVINADLRAKLGMQAAKTIKDRFDSRSMVASYAVIFQKEYMQKRC